MALSDDQYFVNSLRGALGLQPLYGYNEKGEHGRQEAYGSYVRLELYRRLAKPDCKRCGGSGYYDGENFDMRCGCTGLPQRKGQRSRVKGESASPSNLKSPRHETHRGKQASSLSGDPHA